MVFCLNAPHLLCSIWKSTLVVAFHYCLLMLEHSNYAMGFIDVSPGHIPIRLKIIFMIVFETQLCGETEVG